MVNGEKDLVPSQVGALKGHLFKQAARRAGYGFNDMVRYALLLYHWLLLDIDAVSQTESSILHFTLLPKQCHRGTRADYNLIEDLQIRMGKGEESDHSSAKGPVA